MQRKLVKIGLLLIAAVMLVGTAFAGAASAELVTVTNATDLAEALGQNPSVAVSGDTVTLQSDVAALANELNIQNASGITLDLNGYTITISGAHRFARINPTDQNVPSKFILNDTSAGKTGTITGGKATGTARDEKIGGCVFVNGSSFIMNGGNITNCVALGFNGGGGGIYVKKGTLDISDGVTIYNCSSDYLGGALSILHGTFNMTGGNITKCKALGGGGLSSDTSVVTMTGGNITDCSYTGRGQLIYGGGGILCIGVLNISGTANVTGNFKDSDRNNKDNVYLYPGYELLNLVGDFSGSVGVHTASSSIVGSTFGKYIAGNVADAANFFADDDEDLCGAVSGSDLVWKEKPGSKPAYVEVDNWDELVANVTEWTKTNKMRTIVLTNAAEGAYKNTSGTTGMYTGIPVTGMITIMPKAGASDIKIDANQKGRLFNVTETGNLTLKGNNTATLNLTGGYVGNGGGVYVAGTFALESGSITNCCATGEYGGGGVYVKTDGTFNMAGGVITGCKGENGGGVYNKGTFKMTGGSITKCNTTNTTIGRGGGVYVSSHYTFDMAGGSITDCNAINGGGVYTANMFNMTDGTIMNCNATYGGGVYISGNGNFTMKDSTITRCNATNSGGGIGNLGKFTLVNSSVTSCKANNGGGVLNGFMGKAEVKFGNFTMSKGTIKENTASAIGAGVLNLYGNVTVGKAAEITGNDLALVYTPAKNYYSMIIVDAQNSFTGKINNITLYDVATQTHNASVWDNHVVVKNGAKNKDNFTLSTNSTYAGYQLAVSGNDLILSKGSAKPAYVEVGTWSEFVTAVEEWTDKTKMRTIILNNKSLVYEGASPSSGISVKGNITILPNATAGEFKIDADQKGRLFNVTNGGSLTLRANTTNPQATLNLTGGNAPADYSYEQTTCSCGGAVQVLSGGNLTLSDGVTISGCNATYGGGVYVEYGTVTMDGGTITGCKGTYDGGVFAWDGGTFAMSGGEISDCKGTQHKGVAIYGGTFNVSGSAMIPGTGTATVYLKDNESLNLVGPLTGTVKIANPVGLNEKFGNATAGASGAENITSTTGGFIGSINTSTAPYTLEWVKEPLMEAYVVDQVTKANEFLTLEDAYGNVSNGGTIYLKKNVELKKTFKIDKALTINGEEEDGTIHTITSAYDPETESLTEGHLLLIALKNAGGDITLKNLKIDFNGNRGNILFSDSTSKSTERATKGKLEKVQLQNMCNNSISDARSVIYIKGADVGATELTIDIPNEPTLVDRWVATIDMQSRENRHQSNLTIDELPYGAYCKGTPQAGVSKMENGGMIEPVYPIEIELLFGEKLYVWPGFGKDYSAGDWSALSWAATGADFGSIIQLTNDITSTGNPKEIVLKEGVLINASRDGTMINPYTINLTADDHIVVNDLLALASLLGYENQVTYGEGYLIAGQNLTFGDAANIPKDTKIWLDRSLDPVVKNNVTVNLSSEATIPVDEYGLVSLKVNKNLTIVGDGSIKFTDDPLSRNATSLWINGTLNFGVPVTQWPTWGINGTGSINFFLDQNPMPKFADGITVNFAPFSVSGEGSILCDGTAVGANAVLYENGSTWTLSPDKTTITITGGGSNHEYTLSPASGYTGKWVVEGTSGTITKARIIQAVFEKLPEEIIVSSNAINFGTVDLNTTPAGAKELTRTLNVTNNLGSQVSLTLSGSASNVFVFAPELADIPASGNQTYTISIDSGYWTQVGDYSAVLKISNGTSSFDQLVNLSLSIVNTTEVRKNTTVVPNLPPMDVKTNTDDTQNVTVDKNNVDITDETAIIRNATNPTVDLVVTHVINTTVGDKQEIQTTKYSTGTAVYTIVKADLLEPNNEKIDYQVNVSYKIAVPSQSPVSLSGDFNQTYADIVSEEESTKSTVLSMVASENADPTAFDQEVHEVSITFVIPKDNVENPENLRAYHVKDGEVDETITPVYEVYGNDYYNVTVTSEKGFSAYVVSELFPSNPTPYTPSHREQGQTQILQEGEVAPTATPTAEPTLKPTLNPTVKPTTQPTQKSPAPFVGLIAGLGAAALLIRMRR